MNICVIPARGGSKRIPRKNIKLLGGKPIIAHVIETAKSLDFIKKVCVSTDDLEIQNISTEYGAETGDLRASEFAGDFVHFGTLILKDVPRFTENVKDLLMILPTAALVQQGHYYDAFSIYQEKSPQALMSTLEYAVSPLWAMVQDKNGFCKAVHPEFIKMRSQDLPKTCVDAGLFYMMKLEQIKSIENFIADKLLSYNVPPDIAVDVDTPADWEQLEIFYQKQKESISLL